MKKWQGILLKFVLPVVVAIIGLFAYQSNQSVNIKDSSDVEVTQMRDQNFNIQGDFVNGNKVINNRQ